MIEENPSIFGRIKKNRGEFPLDRLMSFCASKVRSHNKQANIALAILHPSKAKYVKENYFTKLRSITVATPSFQRLRWGDGFSAIEFIGNSMRKRAAWYSWRAMRLRKELGFAAKSFAGWLIVLSMIYSPWAMGCVAPWAIDGLVALTILAGCAWLFGCFAERRTPRIGKLVLGCVIFLLGQGWWMVLNAHGSYDPISGRILRTDSLWNAGPGAVDGPVCGAMMWQITGVLSALLVSCDMACDQKWRQRFAWTMALTGSSIALYGLLQRGGLAPNLTSSESAEGAFASYGYWGDAGSYLNLIIPWLFVFSLTATSGKSVRTWIARAGLLLAIAGTFVNLSRATMVIAIAMLLGLGLWAWRRYGKSKSLGDGAMRYQIVGALALTSFVVIWAGRDVVWKRWAQFPGALTPDNPRLLMLKVSVPMARDAGFFGEGPGSFKLLLPTTPYMLPELYPRWKVTVYRPDEAVNGYEYVDNDFLQFVIEWGSIGALVWALLIVGALVKGIRIWHRLSTEHERLLYVAAFSAIAGILAHALVDAPLQIASLQLYTAIDIAILYRFLPQMRYLHNNLSMRDFRTRL